jgi:hypothetical protein
MPPSLIYHLYIPIKSCLIGVIWYRKVRLKPLFIAVLLRKTDPITVLKLLVIAVLFFAQLIVQYPL